MKDKTKNTPQVLLRRALLVLLDAAIVAFSFYFALLLRADGAVDAVWWPHNRALLYENLPWIVAVYIVCFLAPGTRGSANIVVRRHLRAPPRALDRHSTDRDVLPGEKCTRSSPDRTTKGAENANVPRHTIAERR